MKSSTLYISAICHALDNPNLQGRPYRPRGFLAASSTWEITVLRETSRAEEFSRTVGVVVIDDWRVGSV
jgi:hypothetical protein